jgi:hypothetical protein
MIEARRLRTKTVTRVSAATVAEVGRLLDRQKGDSHGILREAKEIGTPGLCSRTNCRTETAIGDGNGGNEKDRARRRD